MTKETIIWLILDSGKIGGIETHVLTLACYLSARAHSVKVIFLNDYSEQPIAVKLKNADIKTIHLDGRLSSFVKLIKREKPNILHVHGYKPGVVGKFIGLLFRIPVVCTHHPGERGQGRIYFYNWLDENLSFLASKNIAVSKPIQNRLLSKNTVLLPNFVELPKTFEISGTLKNCIAFIGRVCHEKGPDLFCKLSEYLSLPLKMHMFGDGALGSSLKKRYENKVIFYGDVHEILPHLKQVDLLCITSRSEGLPIVALEAMSLGIPVISFAVGGLNDLIQNGQNGFLIEPNNLKEFAATVHQYYNLSQKERSAIQIAARQTVMQGYSADVVGSKIEAIYNEVISRK